MMDYRDWIRDLDRFVADVPSLAGEVEHQITVAPPLKRDALANLDKSLRLKIPRPVAQFLERGSGGCVSHYFWEPTGPQAERLRSILDRQYVFGGVPLCDSRNLAQWQDWCVEGATETGLADEPAEKSLWLRAFPFAFMSHGDFLALDLEHGSGDPPVVYLCHDNKSRLLSRSFDDFLVQWRRLCYIGPDLYLFEEFFDPASGYLSGASPKAKALRTLLNVEDAEPEKGTP
jgi:hypothetical protein